MKKRYSILAFLVTIGCSPHTAYAQATTDIHTPSVHISAIQTAAADRAGDEFVIIANTSDATVDVNGWKVQYRSAGATGNDAWITKSTFACERAECQTTISPGEAIVAASFAIAGVSAHTLTSGLSGEGGQVRLLQPGDDSGQLEVVDMVGYGNAAVFEGSAPAASPEAGEVLIRKLTAEGALVDTNDNATDFITGCMTVRLDEPPRPTACSGDTSEGTQSGSPASDDDGSSSAGNYLPLIITELLPDPASPATDSNDEFIEIHNPHLQTVRLAGYKLEAGDNFTDSYVFDDVEIPAGGYYAATSRDTRLSLTNDGTDVRLVGPDGGVQDTVMSYGQAKPDNHGRKMPAAGSGRTSRRQARPIL